MSSSDSLNSATPLKPKKSLNLVSKSPISKTPEKNSSQHPNRVRNRGVALSIKEIRQIAQTRPKPQAQADQVKSARKQIFSGPTESSPPTKTSGDLTDKLPKKYEILCEFFDGLDSAIRLLRLKGSMQTFTNISPKIECLTDRRFSYRHLGQLKHILPEAIELKRVMIFDERTSCMKPDLHVSIQVDAIDCGDKSKSETKSLKLRRGFRGRLRDYLKAHPEGDEIPEEELPEPFNRLQPNMQSNMIKGPIPLSSDKSLTDTVKEQQSLTEAEIIQEEAQSQQLNDQQPVVASHVSRSFRKRFSLKAKSKAQEAVQKSSKVSFRSSNFQVPELCADRCANCDETSSAPPQSPNKFLSQSSIIATPVKDTNLLKAEDESHMKAGNIQSTPAKLSTPARLMTATPTLQPQKRCYMSPDEVSFNSPYKLARRPPCTRSLKLDTPVKEKKVVDEEVHDMAGQRVNDDEDDVLSDLPDSLLNSIRGKERKAMEERDPAISQAKRRQRMIACLPKLFNLIHYLFRDLRRSVITKDELMHKIIAGHCDVTDRGEVEEQLKLLQELAPEWISEKMASAGDLLVCINKMSSAESIRMRLQEAK